MSSLMYPAAVVVIVIVGTRSPSFCIRIVCHEHREESILPLTRTKWDHIIVETPLPAYRLISCYDPAACGIS
eukprot:scaffold497504_cov63-Attheya_sp.AAC.1